MSDERAVPTVWTVGEVALLTRVSVRTLHHYDHLGLLCPSERSESQYRLYSAHDLTRLYQILTFRELGLPLGEIQRLLEDPAQEEQALRTQATLLQERLARMQVQLQQIEAFLNAKQQPQGEKPMSQQEIKALFDSFDHSQYEAEVQERWGDTEAYRQSTERMKRYTPAQLEEMKAQGAALTGRYLALMQAGVPPESPRAAELAEAHRAYFHQWFYDCTPQFLGMVSNMWICDPRFTENIDRVAPGLAAYQQAVVQAWAKDREVAAKDT